MGGKPVYRVHGQDGAETSAFSHELEWVDRGRTDTKRRGEEGGASEDGHGEPSRGKPPEDSSNTP